MPASTQFKVPCPSCEAPVAIKDASLIGKKVDCPKCKYRFVVGEPDDGNESPRQASSSKGAVAAKKGRPRPSADDDEGARRPKTKKSGAPVVLIVGGVIALLAIVGLIVGGIFLFGGNNSTPSSSTQQANNNTGTGTGQRTPSSTGTTQPDSKSPDTNPAASPAEADAAEGNLANVTNLLPNDSQAVYSVNMNKFAGSTLGGSIFRSGSGFRPEMFKEGLGLPMEQMNKFLRAESLKNNWAFNVIQMYPAVSLKVDALKAKLGSQKGAKSPIKGHAYFLVTANQVVDTMSAIDLTTILGQNSAMKPTGGVTMAWHIYDEHTLILADVQQMEEFLQADRKPKQLSRTAGDETPAGSPAAPNSGRGTERNGPSGSGAGVGGPSGAGAGVGGPSGAGTGVGGPAGGNSGPVGSGMGAGGPVGSGMGAGGPRYPGMGGMPGSGSDSLYTERPTYLTVKPELKQMLDQMEKSPKGVIFSCGAIQLEDTNIKLTDAIRSASGLGAQLPLPVIVSAGLGLHVFSDSRLIGVAAVELKQEQDARTLDRGIHTIAFPVLARKLGNWLGGITIEISGQSASSPAPGMGRPGMPGMPGGFSPDIRGPGMGGSGGGLGPPALPGVPGAGSGGMSNYPRGSGARGPGLPGGQPGGPGYPGGQPGGPGFPGAPGAGGTDDAEKPADSFLNSWYVGKYVFISFDIEINTAADEKLHHTIENQVVRMKGLTDVMAMSSPRWHELAGTALALRSSKKVLVGTSQTKAESEAVLTGGAIVSYPPSQRVGFLADLLPYLGRDEIFAQVNKGQSWRSESNLRAGGHWIPQFINPTYPQSSWQAHVPSLPDQTLGATHFVGLGGIGWDAADYPDDPAFAKKLGMFGYNRPTRLENIKDGASNTIFLIQVPPTFQRPWIAGGGATIMGVPEKNSVAPFVSKQANGKVGTYALMADGSVRWIAGDMTDKTFQALVTPNGEDDAGDLNGVAPQINPAAGAAPAPTAGGKPAEK